MRTSTLITGAALAAGAFASPLVKRDLEIDTVYDVSYETVYVTETEGVTAYAVPTSTSAVVEQSAPAVTTSIATVQHYGHRHSWSKAAQSSVVSVTTSVAPVVPSSSAAPVISSSSVEQKAAIPAGYTSAWTSTWASTWVITPSAESTTAVATSSAAPAATTEVRLLESFHPLLSRDSLLPRVAVVEEWEDDCAETVTQASKTSAAPVGKATTYQQRVIAHHNVHRANHSAPALQWDADLANTAATIAATCVYAHSMDVNGGGYGQNIAAGVEANNISAVITELFYNGEVNYFDGLYGQANPDMSNFEKWGHFSQIVWKDTTKVGCATQYCSGGLKNVGQYVSPYFTVCNYGSPGTSMKQPWLNGSSMLTRYTGNYAGEYADNIGSSLNKPTQNWSYNL